MLIQLQLLPTFIIYKSFRVRDKPKDHRSFSIHSIRDGSEAAFECLFRENFRALSFFAHSIIGQELYAKDIVQECFIKLWNRRASLTDLHGLKSYLYTVVKNDCISFLRSQAVYHRKQSAYFSNITEGAMPPTDHEMILAETIRELHNHIEQLPKKMREVMKLYYIEGESHGGISRLLQKNAGTIHQQRRTALRLLREKTSA